MLLARPTVRTPNSTACAVSILPATSERIFVRAENDAKKTSSLSLVVLLLSDFF
jgi:hypothetical protein